MAKSFEKKKSELEKETKDLEIKIKKTKEDYRLDEKRLSDIHFLNRHAEMNLPIRGYIGNAKNPFRVETK